MNNELNEFGYCVYVGLEFVDSDFNGTGQRLRQQEPKWQCFRTAYEAAEEIGDMEVIIGDLPADRIATPRLPKDDWPYA